MAIPASAYENLYNTIIDRLHAKYGSFFIRAAEAGAELGLSAKTVYNQVNEARFPIKTFRRGKLLMVSLVDLARFIVDCPDTGRLDAMRKIRAAQVAEQAQPEPAAPAEQSASPRKRGRPRNLPPPIAAPERCDRTIDFVDAATGGESCMY